MQDLTTQSPVEVDTPLAAIYVRYYDASRELARQAYYLVDYRQGVAKRESGEMRYSSYTDEGLDRLEQRVAQAKATAAAIIAEADPFEAEFTRRGGWTRFFTVRDGHVHSSMRCPTCNKMGKDTEFGWLPEWSGRSEDEALAALVTQSAKTILCSVCYPDAPVEWMVARQDPTVCPGSGTYVDTSLPNRLGFYSGNYGTCPECGDQVTVPGQSGRKLRKHKAAAK